MAAARQVAHEGNDLRLQRPLGAQCGIKFVQRLLARQLAVQQQQRGFFVVAVVGEYVNGVTTISEYAAFAINGGDAGLGGRYARQAAWMCAQALDCIPVMPGR